MNQDIFISYRRESDSGTAGRLYDQLSQELPNVPVFIDVDKLSPGDDFEQALDKSLARCAVVLAVIGPKWAVLLGPNGQPRLLQDDDFVRKELGTALSQGVRVVPVLVQGAQLPSAAALPPELRPLVKRQAFEVRHERFTADVRALAKSIVHSTPSMRRLSFASRKTTVAVAATAVIALMGGAGAAYRFLYPREINPAPAEARVPWSDWLDRSGYQREFDRELSQGRFPRMIEAAKHGETIVYRAFFAEYPSSTFAFVSRHSLTDEEFVNHEALMKSQGYSRAFHQRFFDGDRTFNQGVWTRM